MAEAQQPGKIPQIVLFLTSTESVHGIYVDEFRRGLRDAGYVDGRDIVLEYRFGNAKIAKSR